MVVWAIVILPCTFCLIVFFTLHTAPRVWSMNMHRLIEKMHNAIVKFLQLIEVPRILCRKEMAEEAEVKWRNFCGVGAYSHFPSFFFFCIFFFSKASIAEIFNLKLWDESSVDGASGLRINVLFSLKILLWFSMYI